MVASSQPVAEMTIRKVIEELVRYNEDQPYSFDRDALVSMLEEELDGTRDPDAFRRFGAQPE